MIQLNLQHQENYQKTFALKNLPQKFLFQLETKLIETWTDKIPTESGEYLLKNLQTEKTKMVYVNSELKIIGKNFNWIPLMTVVDSKNYLFKKL